MSGEGVIAAAPSLEQPHEATLPAIREAVIAQLPDSHPIWQKDVRAGLFDDQPPMLFAIAGWYLGRGVAR